MNTQELRELLLAATPGPWEAGTDGWVETVSGDSEDWCYVRRVGTASDVMAQMLHGWEADEQTLRDAELIAAMRNALPDLLDRLEAAEAAVADAWDEGAAAGMDCGLGVGEAVLGMRVYPAAPTNPYRAASVQVIDDEESGYVGDGEVWQEDA